MTPEQKSFCEISAAMGTLDAIKYILANDCEYDLDGLLASLDNAQAFLENAKGRLSQSTDEAA